MIAEGEPYSHACSCVCLAKATVWELCQGSKEEKNERKLAGKTSAGRDTIKKCRKGKIRKTEERKCSNGKWTRA
jgi:hypothetical protein